MMNCASITTKYVDTGISARKTTCVCAPKARFFIQKSIVSIFYTIGSIKDMLNANAIQSSDEFVKELMAKVKDRKKIGRNHKSISL